jgi:hypothetical protein
MNEQQGPQTSPDNEQTDDAANNEVGPTEKLREPGKAGEDFSAPGSQNPESKDIKNEQGPNTE